MKLVGDLILERQTILLGHVLRRDTSNLMRKVTCDQNLRKPEQLYKRTGAPRLNWIDDNLQRVFAQLTQSNDRLDLNSNDHVELILNAALNREF